MGECPGDLETCIEETEPDSYIPNHRFKAAISHTPHLTLIYTPYGYTDKNKRKFSSYIRKFRAVANSYMRKGFVIYVRGNAQIFNHILEGR